MGRWAFILLVLCTAGCGSESSIPGEPCDIAETCGPVGDAICIDGFCHLYDDSSGHGEATVNLSFNRDMPYQVAASAYEYILHNIMADGSTLDCSRILSREVLPTSTMANSLLANPKYYQLNWEGGGNYFRTYVGRIRPAESIVAVAEGYEYLHGEGDLTALGCKDQETIIKEQNVEFVIKLNPP